MTDKIRIFDGAQGTMLAGAQDHEHRHQGVAVLNITNPERVQQMHRDYLEAGAQYITCNSFELNPAKWQSKEYTWQEIADAAIDNARTAVGTRASLMFDVSTSGQLMEPVGPFTFEQAYENYRQVALYTADRVDGYILETFSDLYELRAAILAIRDCCSKPIFATMTFDETGRTLTGSTPEIVALTLSSLGVDALGVNCSTNPLSVVDVIRRMKPFASRPILAQPNKGLPEMRDGQVVYNWTDQDFVKIAADLIEAGASIIGGCCGSSPSTIKAISIYKDRPAPEISKPDGTYICSSTILLRLEKGLICGERLNPTGKKKLKAALAEGNFEYLQHEALAQKDAGADFLDLNCGVPNSDEKALLCQAVRKVQEVCDLPLQLDSSNPEAISAAIRLYNGVPMINSVNGARESMSRLLPIIARFQAPSVTLPLDERGVPESCEGRIEIARRIIKEAEKMGIDRRLLIFDGLVMAISSNPQYGKITIDTLSALKKLGVLTTIGLSNVSFGLPERGTLNRNFLAMAFMGGLDMPIMNPLDRETVATVRASMALTGNDPGCAGFIYFNTQASGEQVADNLYNAVSQGLKDRVKDCIEREMPDLGKDRIINEVLIPALGDVGARFARNEVFMPQLIRSAEAAKLAFAVISEQFSQTGSDEAAKGHLVIATVKGDVHDIGKNIVKVVVQSHGFSVTDLGKDVPKETVLEAALNEHPDAIGLSALMTTTVDSMKETIEHLRANGITCPIIVGGAVMTRDIASAIGATYYSKDALETAHIMQHICLHGDGCGCGYC
ncbi:MAG: homocysteine S-methyltransferase family protein [Bacteroidaceae bacterium]|nr:homocysteine S-methyltransferase family protein [Bacteroidaceae bacterium]